MANIYSLKSGLASDTTVWSGGAVPVQGDRVLINKPGTALSNFNTNGAAYAIGANSIVLGGAPVAASYVIGEAVQFPDDNTYYTVLGWNSATKTLTIDPLVVAIPAVATQITNRGHVVTLDGAYIWGDDSNATVVINAISTTNSIWVKGTIKASRAVSSSLTHYGSSNFQQGGTLDFGTEADPIPLGVTAKIILNKTAAAPAHVKYGMYFAPGSFTKVWGGNKVRVATFTANALAGATTLEVSDATGLAAGDLLGLSVSDNSVAGRSEIATIAAGYVGGLSIPLAAPLQFFHDAGHHFGCLSGNVEVTSETATARGFFSMSESSLSVAGCREIGDCVFSRMPSVYPYYGISYTVASNYSATPYPALLKDIKRVAFYTEDELSSQQTFAFSNQHTANKPVFRDCVLYGKATNVSGHYASFGGRIALNNVLIISTVLSPIASFGTEFNSVHCYGRNQAIMQIGGGSFGVFSSCEFVGAAVVAVFSMTAQYSALDYQFNQCDFTKFTARTNPELFYLQSIETPVQYTLNNCSVIPGFVEPTVATMKNLTDQSWFRMDAYNNDPKNQFLATNKGILRRNNTQWFRSASSESLRPIGNGDLTRLQKIPCANGKTVRIVGYVKMDTAFWNAGNNNLPTVTISGLGITPVVFTASAAANNAWEQFDLSATNTAGYDGNLTLTYTANAKAVTTGTVYFDGVPDAPFVTQCRHYGFDLTQETIPTRTVDPYVVATEATADAYTGITIDGTAKTIAFGAGTGDTAQKFYDYTRAWACLNLSKDIPLNRAGTLYSLAAGWTVIDPVLTGLTWGGETIQWNSAGAKTGSFSGNTFNFTAPTPTDSYDFAASTFSGTVEFVNTSGGAVVVDVPAGTSYTNTGPSITVNVAVDQAEALISGIVAGSRLQIYNVTTATEMVNAINATTSYSLGYPNGTDYSAGDVVRVRLTYCVGITAKLPVEYVTIASAAGWSVLANQQDDEVYIANGIDGSTVTEYSSDYVNVQIDVSDPDGVTSIQRGYAWYCDQITGDDGIRYFFGAFQAEDAFNYLLNTDVADIRIQNTGVNGVTLTGGAVRRKDGSSPLAPGGSVYIYYGRAYSDVVTVSGSNVITGDISEVAPAVQAALQLNQVLTLPNFLATKD